jgi:hypothetical protein
MQWEHDHARAIADYIDRFARRFGCGHIAEI